MVRVDDVAKVGTLSNHDQPSAVSLRTTSAFAPIVAGRFSKVIFALAHCISTRTLVQKD